jgi:hypothetical protein
METKPASDLGAYIFADNRKAICRQSASGARVAPRVAATRGSSAVSQPNGASASRAMRGRSSQLRLSQECRARGIAPRADAAARPLQSGWRELPNMISSQEGTDARRDRPPAALRAGRSRTERSRVWSSRSSAAAAGSGSAAWRSAGLRSGSASLDPWTPAAGRPGLPDGPGTAAGTGGATARCSV